MHRTVAGYEYRDITFAHVLADKAARNGDKIFLTYLPDGRSFSYADIDLLSNRIANGLLERGVGKGSHVALLMENSPDHILSHFALGKLGAVAVPINIAARGEFLRYYLDQSDCTALITDRGFLEAVLAVAPSLPLVDIFVLDETGAEEALYPLSTPRLHPFSALLCAGDAPPAIQVSFSDIASIMYTSGTTGPSKGNIFTQIHTLTYSHSLAEAFEYTENDRFHICLPLFHAAGYHGGILTMLMADGSVALARKLSVSAFWDEIRRSQATLGMLLSISGFLMAQPPSPDDSTNSLRIALTSPMPANFADFEARFGVQLVQAYGLTDYCMPLAQPIDIPSEKKFSIGRPARGVQVRIVGDDDEDVRPGVPGEILLRKDDLPFAASQGYYRMPQATVDATRNLWFHTGDRGYYDEDGYYYFVDRKKDAIRRRGENISTFEVERVIAAHPSIAEVAVYPVSADTGEDEVAASIVFKTGSQIELIELIDFCREAMPEFMVPRFVDVRSELPRTLTQKLRKNEMRDHTEANIAAIFDVERVRPRVPTRA